MKQQNLFAILFLSFVTTTYGQIGHFTLSISGAEMYTQLDNKIIGAKITGKPGNGLNILGDITISDYLAFGSGISYTHYASTVSLGSFYSEISKIDDEGDYYKFRVYGTNLKENQSIDMLELPLVLTIQNQSIKKWNPYFQFGMHILFPIQSDYSCLSGNIETRGYYPDLNVELKDMTDHGFGAYNLTNTSGSINTKVGYALSAEFGTLLGLHGFRISTALFGVYGLSGISRNSELYNTQNGYQSLASVSKVMPLCIGISIGFFI